MADLLSSIRTFVLGGAEYDVVEEAELTEAEQVTAQKVSKTQHQVNHVVTQKVVNGPTMTYETSEPITSYTAPTPTKSNLKVIKQERINVLVFTPTTFDDIRDAATALKEGKSVIISFERIEQVECTRICDFMNGACYVLDGSVKKISSNMFLYVPSGISIEHIELINK